MTGAIQSIFSKLNPLMRFVLTPVTAAGLLAISQYSLADNHIAVTHNYPGGVVELLVPRQSGVLPEVRYGTREPVIIEQAANWRLLIGLSLNTLPGEYLVHVKQPESDLPAYSIKFSIGQKNYPVLESKSGVVARSKNIQHEILSELTFTNTEQPKLPLMSPVAGQWADHFGHLALEPGNDVPVAQNYVSLTTTELATVTAPQNAIVSRIIAGPEPESLATVFLDHGRGLYSVISGLTDLSVEPGNGVIAGAVIGKLPVDTRSGEPTVLLWQCLLNGVYINPLILTKI